MTHPPRSAPCRRPRPARWAAPALVLAALVAWPHPAGAAAAERRVLGHPGILVVADAAADTSGVYRWQQGPGPDQRSLVWAEGQLVVPADLRTETFGPRDLAVPCGPGLAGSSHDGQLEFRPGTYRISSPLLLSDGRVSLHASAGTLEIVGERLRYAPPPRGARNPLASYLLLAGLVILTFTLLRRARRGRSA